MKNIINFPLDFQKIPASEKKYLYLHNDLYRGIPIDETSNAEKLVEITNDEIRLEPFWEDEILLTGDPEIDDILFLETEEMQHFLKSHPRKFGIFVRETVKKKLLNIHQKLYSMGYILTIKIGYRPLEVQKNLFMKIRNFYQKKYPNASEQEIYEMTTQMISNPNRDVAPHTTGAAVDVILYTRDGKLVDMGCPVNFIGETSNWTTNQISAEARSNRNILAEVFLSEGFSTLASEWWHFSYGDPYWACFSGEKMAKYDATEL